MVSWGAGLVNSGASESYNVQGIEIAKIAERDFKDCIVKTTLGWHPEECIEWIITAENISEKMSWLKDMIVQNRQYVVAVWECGIDLHYPDTASTLAVQQKLFAAHCDLARELNLPLVIHSRDAFEETFEVIKNYTDLTIYFHCWGYGPNEFHVLHSNFEKVYIGFCGNVTYKNAQAIRDTLAIVAPEKILLETDAPYLAPQIVRGEINHPANVQYIYEFVAQELNVSVDMLAERIESNFTCVYWV